MKIIKIGAVWCPACIVMNSRWEKLKKKFPDYIYEEYDYDQDEEYVKTRNVGKILPVFILMNKNVEIDRIIGEKTEKELIETIKKNGVK